LIGIHTSIPRRGLCIRKSRYTTTCNCRRKNLCENGIFTHMSKYDLEPLAVQLAKQSETAARLLRVMSNKHRLRVLCGLVGGEKSVGELNDEIPVSQSVLSQHLAVLRRARLVQTRREAQVIYYSMTPGPAQNVIAVLHDAFCSPGHGEAAGSTCAPPTKKTSGKPKRR